MGRQGNLPSWTAMPRRALPRYLFPYKSIVDELKWYQFSQNCRTTKLSPRNVGTIVPAVGGRAMAAAEMAMACAAALGQNRGAEDDMGPYLANSAKPADSHSQAIKGNNLTAFPSVIGRFTPGHTMSARLARGTYGEIVWGRPPRGAAVSS